MKIKGILKSLLLSYTFTGIFLFLLAFILYKLDLNENAASIGIIIIYILSCMIGGFAAGKIMRKDKYLWGLGIGVVYFGLLLITSVAVQKKFDITLGQVITTFCMCLGGGALGGMLA